MDVFPTFFIVLWIIMCIFVAEINAFVLHMNPRHKFKPQISALCLLLLAVLLVACEADTLPFNLPPTLTVSVATNIYRKGATISGTYTKANENVGVETFGLLYATNSLLGDADTIYATPAEITAGSYTATLSGLNPSTTYYYATFATSGSSIAKSDISHFTTKANSTPQLGELQISNVTASSCVLSTSVLDDGGSALTLRGFLYKKAPTNVSQLTIQDNQVNVSDDSEAFTATLSGLEENTRYAVCAYAVSAAGVGYSEINYIVTLNQYIPVLSPVSAYTTDIANTLYVSASVTSEGAEQVTERGFVFSTEGSEPNVESNSKVVATGTNGGFTAAIANLLQDRTTYIRAYARSGDVYGYGETFVYNPSEWPVLTTGEATNIWENTAKLNATMNMRSSSITECGFVWSQNNTTPTLSDGKLTTTASASIGIFFDGLNPSTKYYYRPFACHAKGITYGAVSSFTTTSDTGNVQRDTYGDDTEIE